MKTRSPLSLGIVGLLLFLFLSTSTQASNHLPPVDARSFSLGNAFVLTSDFGNPALLSFRESSQVGVSVLNSFGMKELNTGAVWGIFPNSFLHAGAKLSSYGYDEYRITQVQVALSKLITENLSLGVSAAYSQLFSILEEEKINNLYADLGLYYRLTEEWNLALLLENLLHTEDDSLIKVALGASWQLLENALLLLQASYCKEEKLLFSLGGEYELMDQFLVRVGYQTEGKAPSFGAGYQWEGWGIDVGFSLHNILGLSSMIALSYQF